jgi:hypothetical protein
MMQKPLPELGAAFLYPVTDLPRDAERIVSRKGVAQD